MKALDEIKQLMSNGETAKAAEALKQLQAAEPDNLRAKMHIGLWREARHICWKCGTKEEERLLFWRCPECEPRFFVCDKCGGAKVEAYYEGRYLFCTKCGAGRRGDSRDSQGNEPEGFKKLFIKRE